MPPRSKQREFFPRPSKQYGGELLKTRKGRAHGRPLVTRQSMHVVLRSSVAKGDWSMNRSAHRRRVGELICKFAHRHGVRVYSFANVGNHIHLHIQLRHLRSYRPFIRGLTSAIAMAITGISRWSGDDCPARQRLEGRKFWDYRPFTRIISGRRDFIGVKDYIAINQMEGQGVSRHFGKYALNQVRKWENLAETIRERWRMVTV